MDREVLWKWSSLTVVVSGHVLLVSALYAPQQEMAPTVALVSAFVVAAGSLAIALRARTIVERLRCTRAGTFLPALSLIDEINWAAGKPGPHVHKSLLWSALMLSPVPILGSVLVALATLSVSNAVMPLAMAARARVRPPRTAEALLESPIRI